MVGYMITNGKDSYIRHDAGTNKYVPVNGQNRGTSWKDLKKADNILKGLAKNLRPDYYVIQVAADTESNGRVNNPPQSTANVNGANSISIEELTAIDISAIRGFEQWRSRAEEVLQFLQDAEDRTAEINAALSMVDKEVTDLLHYMEFNKLNASDGYIIYRKVHETLLRRREIKNEEKVMAAIRYCSPSKKSLACVLNAINGIDTQKYTPRVLSELFER